MIGIQYFYKLNCENHHKNELMHTDEYFNKILEIQDNIQDPIIILIKKLSKDYIIEEIETYNFIEYLKLINKEYLKDVPEILDLIYKPYDFPYKNIYVISDYEYLDFDKLNILQIFKREFEGKSLKYLPKILKNI